MTLNSVILSKSEESVKHVFALSVFFVFTAPLESLRIRQRKPLLSMYAESLFLRNFRRRLSLRDGFAELFGGQNRQRCGHEPKDQGGRPEILQADAADDYAAQYLHVMGGGHNLADYVKRGGDVVQREDEAGKQDGGDQQYDDHLQGLALIVGHNADQQSQGQSGQHKRYCHKDKFEEAAFDGNIKEQPGRKENNGEIEHGHDGVRGHFAQHEAEFAYRRHHHLFHGAVFFLFNQAEAG